MPNNSDYWIFNDYEYEVVALDKKIKNVYENLDFWTIIINEIFPVLILKHALKSNKLRSFENKKCLDLIHSKLWLS